ncbi:MAG: universal stress protein [Treponemataceae bacterium]|nr:universal stress protein [Treponemataceae bacterium]
MIKTLFKNVLVVVNSSEASIHAVQYGILLAKLYKCNVKVVYVVDTATIKRLTLTKFLVQEESEECEKRLIEDGERYLKYAENIAASKGIKIETQIRKGSVCAEVVAAANEIESELILLGGFQKAASDSRDVISSSYRQILLEAHCSVLVVKEENIENLYKMA